jgi:hypothetical protein
MRKLLVIFLGFFMISASYQQREDAAAGNAKLKVMFMYNFTKMVKWPDEYNDGNFIIGVYGTYAPLLVELNKMANVKTVGSQKFEIKPLSSIEPTGKYHILFVSNDKLSQFSEITAKLKGKGTLLITENAGMMKRGSIINFVVVDNKIKFELSKANAEKQKLKIGHELEALAIKGND